MNNDSTLRTCTKCGEVKSTTEFSKHTSMRDGLALWCRACTRAASAAWRAANKEKVKKYNAAWRATNTERVSAYKAVWYAANTERIKATTAVRYASNPDKMKARVAAWNAANPERVKAVAAAWAAANPESRRIYKQNRRARKREAGGSLSKGLSERLFKLQRGKCACGCKQPLGNNHHLDHIMPLALGGTNTDDNIQLLRATCNHQKHAKHPVDFMQSRGFLI